jgi:uncharacterized protein (DUF952 family)
MNLALMRQPILGYKLVSNQNWKNFIKTKSNKCYGFDDDITCGFVNLTKKENIPIVFEKKFNKEISMMLMTIDLDSVENLEWVNDYPRVYGPIYMDKDVVCAEHYSFLKLLKLY